MVKLTNQTISHPDTTSQPDPTNQPGPTSQPDPTSQTGQPVNLANQSTNGTKLYKGKTCFF